MKFVSRLFDEPARADSESKAGKPGRRGGPGGGGGAKSLSANFRADLGSLMEAINAADPHFVRALNPNAQVVPFNHISNIFPSRSHPYLSSFSLCSLCTETLS
jgi:myosin heavy subunit